MTDSSSSAVDLESLRDDLVIAQTILASLQDAPRGHDTLKRISDARLEVLRIHLKISQARCQQEVSKRPLDSTGAMYSRQHDPAFAADFAAEEGFAGPSTCNSSENHTPAIASASSCTSTLRKRSSAPPPDENNPFGSPAHKSRRTTSNRLQTTIATPIVDVGDDFSADDGSIIDLTGDDEDINQVLERQKTALAQAQQAKLDERLARSIQNDGFNPVSESTGPNAFDMMLGRLSQSFQGQPHQDPSLQNQSVYCQGREPNQVPRIPGSFDLDEDSRMFDDSFPDENSSLSIATGLYTGGPSSTGLTQGGPSFPGPILAINQGPTISTTESAWRADLARHRGHVFPSTHGTGAGPTSSDGFASYAGDASPMASIAYQPAMPSAGSYAAAYQSWGASGTYNPPYFPNQRPAASRLAALAERTGTIDWDKGLDSLGNPLSDRLRAYYEDLNDDPRKTAKEIQDLLANIHPDEDIPEENRVGTPEALRYPLYPHQQLALQWMMSSETGKNKGGILADDMGLGKTISTLALLVSRPSSDRIKTNLIVGPVALIKQWELEIKKKLKPHYRLSILLLHNKVVPYEEIWNYDVVLTSYGKIGAELKRLEFWKEQHPNADASKDAGLARSCPLLHPASSFYRVVLDEAQCIKNDKTQQAKGACAVKATYRWCLTGTPMMNGVHELFSLIKFLKIAPYHDQKAFNRTFGSLTPKSTRDHGPGQYAKSKAMSALRVLLKATMLRRMKTSTLDGKPLVKLLPKKEQIAEVKFSEDEERFYNDLETKTRITFNKYLRAGTIGKNYSNILVLLLRLRQACCHPHLNLDVECASNNDISGDDMNALAKTLAPAVVARLKAQNEEGFKCPICFDAVIDPTIVLPCGHNSCGECFTTLAERAARNNLRAGDEGNLFRCPECRGPISPNRVINLTSFRKVHLTDLAQDDENETPAEAGEAASDSDSESDSDVHNDGQIGGKRNFGYFTLQGKKRQEEGEGKDAEDEAFSGDDDALFVGQTMVFGSKKAKREKGKGKGRSKAESKAKPSGKQRKEDIKPHMLKTLRIEARKNKTEHKRYMKYLKRNWMPSAKVTECCKILEAIQESGDKTIIFSQFTFLLDLLEIPIKYELKIKYCRYDGGMSRPQRDAAAQEFQDPNSRTKVMLVSLKAGNAGLNLTAANHVVVMDPFWNPYIEMQAVDRAHRIGQQKEVQVHRLLVKETVEDRIARLQEQKREFVDAALDEGERKSLGRLSTRELQRLFNGD